MGLGKKFLAALLGVALILQSGAGSWAYAAQINRGPAARGADRGLPPTVLSISVDPSDFSVNPLRAGFEWEDRLRAQDLPQAPLKQEAEESPLAPRQDSPARGRAASSGPLLFGQERRFPLRGALSAIGRRLERQDMDPQADLTQVYDHAHFSPGIDQGETPGEVDAGLAESIFKGQAWKVWSHSRNPPLQGDEDIPRALDSSFARRSAVAIEQAEKIIADHESGMGYETKGGADFWLKISDIVIVEWKDLLLHVGIHRSTLYVGQALWDRLLPNPRILAALLENGLYHLAYPDERVREEQIRRELWRKWQRSGSSADFNVFLNHDNYMLNKSEMESGQRMAETREYWIDPDRDLRRVIADITAPSPLFLIGIGSQARMVRLMLERSLEGRQSLDLLGLLREQWAMTAPRLRSLLGECRTWWERQYGLTFSKKRELRLLNTSASNQKINQLDRIEEQAENKRAEVERWENWLNAFEARLHAEEEPSIDARQYAEIMGRLLQISSLEEGLEARRLFNDTLTLTLEGAEFMLRMNPIYASLRAAAASGRVRRFFTALREEAGVPAFTAQTHETATLYEHPGLMSFAVFLREADGLFFSIHRGVIEYWLSDEGRADLARNLPGLKDRIQAADGRSYARFIAQALLHKTPWETGSSEASLAHETLLKSGADVLERSYYGRLPDLEAAYQREKSRNTMRWGLLKWAVLPMLGLLEFYSFFAMPGWWLTRHVLGYLVAVAAEFCDLFSDKRSSAFTKREFIEEAESPSLLGLKTLVEKIARRGGFETNKIYVSNDPSPEAWMNKRAYNRADVVLSRSLLEITLEQGDQRAFEAVVGQAVAHASGASRSYKGLTSAVIWNLLDLVLLATGFSGWVIWGLLAVPSYFLSAWISRSQARIADILGARLSAEPEALASFYKGIHDSLAWGESRFSWLELLLPWAREPNREERAERLRSLSHRAGARD